jgi:hypothetical protein
VLLAGPGSHKRFGSLNKAYEHVTGMKANPKQWGKLPNRRKTGSKIRIRLHVLTHACTYIHYLDYHFCRVERRRLRVTGKLHIGRVQFLELSLWWLLFPIYLYLTPYILLWKIQHVNWMIFARRSWCQCLSEGHTSVQSFLPTPISYKYPIQFSS